MTQYNINYNYIIELIFCDYNIFSVSGFKSIFDHTCIKETIMASRLKILLYNIGVFKSICENWFDTLHTDIQITVHAIFKVKL